jgi:hypothetical protein
MLAVQIALTVVVCQYPEGTAVPASSPWMWTLAIDHHGRRWTTHGYEATREAAMAAFAKSWRRA